MTKRARICLFTGISGRLGGDFSARYAADYDIVGVYWQRAPAVPFCSLAATRRPAEGVYAVRKDLGADGAVEELVAEVLDRFGSVDVVVNAAVHRRFGPATDKGLLDSLDWQFYLNVCVPARVVGALVEQTWQSTVDTNRRRRRNVVNLSSTAGQIVYPASGQSGYSATKAALDMFTLHSAGELAAVAIRANAIAPNTFPGLVATEAVSDAIVRFDRGSQTGQILVIDTDGESLLPSRRPDRS